MPKMTGRASIRISKRALWPHQRDMLAYAMRAQHPALFVEMRLGKSLVFIRRALAYKPRGDDLQVLIIAPNSALDSWRDELRTERVSHVRLHGSKETRRKILHGCDYSWVLANREIYRVLPDDLKAIPWDAVCIDESYCIKNPKTNMTKYYTTAFAHVPHRWIMCGNPNAESEVDLFCQLQFVEPRPFGCKTFWQFRSKYFTPLGFSWSFASMKDKQQIHDYTRRRALVMRRKDLDLEPTKVYQKRTAELSSTARAAYDKTAKEFTAEMPDGQEQFTKWAPVKFLWLRRLAGGFSSGGTYAENHKLRVLSELLFTELKGASVVIWCAFNAEIDYLYTYLKQGLLSVAKYTGEESIAERTKSLRQFQCGDDKIFLGQVACANSGLDLSVSDTVIYFSGPTSAMIREQSEDRIVSLQKLNRSLLYVDLVTKDTVDEDVYLATREKKFRSAEFMHNVFAKLRRKHGSNLERPERKITYA